MNEHFKEVGDTVLFIGDKLEIFIPDRYEQHGCLGIGEDVVSLGIFDMRINDTLDVGYNLPAKIAIRPSNIEIVSIEGDRFYKLTLLKDDVFIKNINIVQDGQLAYIIFYEQVYGGKIPKFTTYDNASRLFDVVGDVTGVKFNTDHVIFEMITAMLHRDKDDITEMYRLTSQTKPAANIPLRLISHAATSTSAKIIGAYLDDGIDSALVNAADKQSDIEDLLRR